MKYLPNVKSKIQSSNVKIEDASIRKKSNKLIILCDKLKTIQYELFFNKIRQFYTSYDNIVKNIINKILLIDCVKSNTKTAIKYSYHKPTIDDTAQNSFLKVKDILQ